MSEVLLKTRCKEGWLVITEQAVRIERAGIFGAGGRLDVMPRKLLVSAHVENKMAAIFGKGGASTVVFTAMGTALSAHLVNPADAMKAMEILGFA